MRGGRCRDRTGRTKGKVEISNGVEASDGADPILRILSLVITARI